MADTEKNTNNIDTVSTGANILEKLAKLVKDYGFFGILKTIFKN